MSTSHYTQIVNGVCAGLAEDPDQRLRIDVVHDGLDELAKAEPEDATLRALADACAYQMLNEGNESAVACGHYDPMFFLSHDDGARVYPVPLDSVGTDVLDIWRVARRQLDPRGTCKVINDADSVSEARC